MRNHEDSKLWCQMIDGNEHAFEQLMVRHFRLLFQYGSKFSKDTAFVKDCIQEVLLMVWERRQNLSREAPAKPYLMASLRRKIHRSYNTRIIYGDVARRQENLPFEIEFSIENHIIEHETTLMNAKQIQQLLNSLPKRQQEVVYLRFFQNLDREHISEIMGIAPQTVSNLLQIAIKYMKNAWNTHYFSFLLLCFLG